MTDRVVCNQNLINKQTRQERNGISLLQCINLQHRRCKLTYQLLHIYQPVSFDKSQGYRLHILWCIEKIYVSREKLLRTVRVRAQDREQDFRGRLVHTDARTHSQAMASPNNTSDVFILKTMILYFSFILS